MLGKVPPNHLELIHQGAALGEETEGLAEVFREEEVGRGTRALAPEPQCGFSGWQLRVHFYLFVAYQGECQWKKKLKMDNKKFKNQVQMVQLPLVWRS